MVETFQRWEKVEAARPLCPTASPTQRRMVNNMGDALRRTNYLYPGYSFNLPSYHAQFGAQTGGSSKDKG